ncbi:MAG: hypothetical protein BGO14_10135 [Chlamydiales bacterium 38-26]|nr:hypothetical protein [Chlamydiales bacterium]OJV11323.1 MAG: hypothetical protein BGO14_10135 [Chlamydiales bacterium 38-26]
MEKKWLKSINVGLCLLISLLLLSAIGYVIARPKDTPIHTVAATKRSLPKNPFTQSKAAYDSIKGSILKLKYSPMTLQLPDLRKFLVYYGKNNRPDAREARPLMHFAFVGNKTLASVAPGEKMFVMFDRQSNPHQYIFSPGNAETPLWIQATSNEQEAYVKVGMKNEDGTIIQDPWSHAQFTLPQKEFARTTGTAWEIGKWRVDGSLLARQKARWYGVDKFLENHGGEEYHQDQNKQRIDFGEGEGLYSVFMSPGDGLIWVQDRWKVVKPGPDSIGFPLLTIKKVDERLIQFEIWDAEGQSRVPLNLLKSSEPWMPQNVLQNFKFLGSRTRSQFVFEVNKERMLISPKDWLVLTPKGWQKLNSPQEVDDYVNRKITGILFVFDGIERRADQQYLIGTLYNPSRSDAKPVEIAITPTPIGRRKVEPKEKIDENFPNPRIDSPPPELNYMQNPIPPMPAQIKKFDPEKAMQLPSGYEN